MDRRHFITSMVLAACSAPLGALRARASRPGKIESWGIIAAITGATPDEATGIPVLANYLRINLTYKWGFGGAPYLVPSVFERAHWSEFIDPVLRIEEFTSARAESALATMRGSLGRPDFVALIGHSRGGNAALGIANSGSVLSPVDLLITLDPYATPLSRITRLAAGAARRTANFYTNRGPGPVHGAPIENMRNIFLGDDRCPLSDCNVGLHHAYTHTNIDDCDYIKRQVFALVQECFPD